MRHNKTRKHKETTCTSWGGACFTEGVHQCERGRLLAKVIEVVIDVNNIMTRLLYNVLSLMSSWHVVSWITLGVIIQCKVEVINVKECDNQWEHIEVALGHLWMSSLSKRSKSQAYKETKKYTFVLEHLYSLKKPWW